MEKQNLRQYEGHPLPIIVGKPILKGFLQPNATGGSFVIIFLVFLPFF